MVNIKYYTVLTVSKHPFSAFRGNSSGDEPNHPLLLSGRPAPPKLVSNCGVTWCDDLLQANPALCTVSMPNIVMALIAKSDPPKSPWRPPVMVHRLLAVAALERE